MTKNLTIFLSMNKFIKMPEALRIVLASGSLLLTYSMSPDTISKNLHIYFYLFQLKLFMKIFQTCI